MEDAITNNEQLKNEVNLLYLIYHRNKNQHRHSNWWKYFKLLLNNLKRLCLGGITVEEFMRKKLIVKCFYEFNGIIALGQFVNLGFVLVGALSKVNEILNTYYKPRVGERVDFMSVEDIGEEVEVGVEVVEVEGKVDMVQGAQVKVLESEVKSSKDTISLPREPKPKKRKSNNPNDKKKKKKKSDIDKLFG